MFIFDIFKPEARRLRIVSSVVALGMAVLLGRLWYVQVVTSGQMQHTLMKQSYREPQIPAERGRIFDRDGAALVENHQQYNVVLYMEDLRSQFTNEYSQMARDYVREHAGFTLGHLPSRISEPLRLEADYRVVSNITRQTAEILQQPVTLDRDRFIYFYTKYTFMPLLILTNLNAAQVAVFSEKLSSQPWLDLERQPLLTYPHGSMGAHLLGYVVRTGENKTYLPPDYVGKSGLQAAFDDYLRGEPGTNLVLVNNEGYRQHVETLAPKQAGSDLYLTISLPIQEAAEKALAHNLWGKNVRGAVVVMDVHNGDVLALASAPTFEPEMFATHVSQAQLETLADPILRPQINRATYDVFPPGSTFKIITSIAGFEAGLIDVNAIFHSPGRYTEFHYDIDDTAPPGDYKFEKAFYHSSNTYFCFFGYRLGLSRILEVARRFHLGEKTDFATHEEKAGFVPPPSDVGKTIKPDAAPYVAIGQEITVTPLQMAGMISVMANAGVGGGTLYWPRVVREIRNSETGEVEESFPVRVRDHVSLNLDHVQIIRRAMLGDTETNGANAYRAFHPASGPTLLEKSNFQVAGKTGTAQVKSSGLDYKHVIWFDSYGPYNDPRYAVIVMLVHDGSGGDDCAPVAKEVYEGIVKMEKSIEKKPTLTQN